MVNGIWPSGIPHVHIWRVEAGSSNNTLCVVVLVFCIPAVQRHYIVKTCFSHEAVRQRDGVYVWGQFLERVEGLPCPGVVTITMSLKFIVKTYSSVWCWSTISVVALAFVHGHRPLIESLWLPTVVRWNNYITLKDSAIKSSWLPCGVDTEFFFWQHIKVGVFCTSVQLFPVFQMRIFGYF